MLADGAHFYNIKWWAQFNESEIKLIGSQCGLNEFILRFTEL